MTFVPYERLTIYIGGFVGTPQALTLDVLDPSDTITSYVLGTNPEVFGSAATEYAFSFVPTDRDGGIWKYRWRGRDAEGKEFARPSDQRWNQFTID